MEAYAAPGPGLYQPSRSAHFATGRPDLARILRWALNAPTSRNGSVHGLAAAQRLFQGHNGSRHGPATHLAQALSGSGTLLSLVREAQSSSDSTYITQVVTLGLPRGLEQKYTTLSGEPLGKGGNGLVTLVEHIATGEKFACKAIPKALSDTASETKRAGHIQSIQREIQVLTTLRGSLNIVKLEEVFEDDDYVYVIMEVCKGGELHHAIGARHYSERTAASYMRAVLRTLGQCHAHNVLHRDVKPGNFMLLNHDPRSPLKAIDFGLATPFDPQQLPRTDLGLEGTPWYMAPETLRSEVLPASDVWAAGVMAFQLLTGRFPFDDWLNPGAPSISAIWRSVLTDELNFNKPCWEGISAEARDFVARLLEREPGMRPTAKEALEHPWLKGNSKERSTGKRINASVVQSIQRYASASVFKRTVLQSIAAELLALEQPPPSVFLSSSGVSVASLASMDCPSGMGHADFPPPAPSKGSPSPFTTPGGPGALPAATYVPQQQQELVNAGAGGAPSPQPVHRTSGGGGLPCLGGSASNRFKRRDGVMHPRGAGMEALYRQLRFAEGHDQVDRSSVAEAFEAMGIQLEASELERLMESLDLQGAGQGLQRSAFAASQMDWRHVQRNHRDEWLGMARRAFESIDTDADGVLDVEDLLAHLRKQLPAEEVQLAVNMALHDAQASHESGIDFDQFLAMLRVGSLDDLELYDDKMSHGSNGSLASLDRLNSMLQQSLADASRHGPGGSAHGPADAGASLFGSSSAEADRSLTGGGMFAMDASRHGASSSRPQQQQAPAPGAIQFRFDVGPPKPPPLAPAGAVQFRFDTGPSSGGGGAAQARDRGGSDAAGQIAADSDASRHTTSGGGGGEGMLPSGFVASNISPIKPLGGWFDRRMHGNGLFASAMESGLTTVRE